MVGLVRYERGTGSREPEQGCFCGVGVLTVTLREPERLGRRGLERRLSRLERSLRRAGVSRVIVPPDFPYPEGLAGLRAVSPVDFYRGAADVLALGWLELHGIAPERGRVALAGPRLSPELRRAARLLCPRVREVRIDVPGREGAEFARELSQSFGLPVTPPTAAADVRLAFGPAAGGAQLSLFEGNLALDGLRLRAEGVDLPPELEPCLLTLLWERGAIRGEDLWAEKAVNFPQTLANGGEA